MDQYEDAVRRYAVYLFSRGVKTVNVALTGKSLLGLRPNSPDPIEEYCCKDQDGKRVGTGTKVYQFNTKAIIVHFEALACKQLSLFNEIS